MRSLFPGAVAGGLLLSLSALGAEPVTRAYWQRVAAELVPRNSHAVAYDPVHHHGVLFGGCTASQCQQLSGQTWLWNGRSWSLREGLPSPPARSLAAMAFHAARQRVVLFGGTTGDSTLDDTWLWDDSSWQLLAPDAARPSARSGHAMAYDGASGKVILFGGHSASEQPLTDTWVWDGAWTQVLPSDSSLPVGRPSLTNVLDDQGQERVLLAVAGDATTRLWDGAKWVAEATPLPAVMARPRLAYDPVQKQRIVFDDQGSGLWVNSGGGWKASDTPPSSLERTGRELFFDSDSEGWSRSARASRRSGTRPTRGPGSARSRVAGSRPLRRTGSSRPARPTCRPPGTPNPRDQQRLTVRGGQ